MIQKPIRLSLVKGPSQEDLLRTQKRELSLLFVDAKGGKHTIFPRTVSLEAGSSASFIFSYETLINEEKIRLKGYCDYRGRSLRGWIEIPRR